MRAVLLQVRLDSTRLPGKALLKLGDYTVIEHAMRSLKNVKCDQYIVVTTSDSEEKLKPLTEKWGFQLFTGSKDNVLKRYVKAIEKYNISQVIRATGDNPLVSWELANILIEKHNREGYDYSGFLNNPVGTGVEVVNSEHLIKALNETKSDYDREHVTPYIYKNRDKFKVFQSNAPADYLLKDSYVTIDTIDDYNRIEKLFYELYHGSIITIESVIKWLKREQ